MAHDDQAALRTADHADHESSTRNGLLLVRDLFGLGLHREIKFLGTVIRHADAAALPVLAVAGTVVLAGLASLNALAVASTRGAHSTSTSLSPAGRRTIDLTTETGLADVEHLVTPTASDLLGRFFHHSGGEELDGIAELRENDPVDRTLLRRGDTGGSGCNPGPHSSTHHHRYAARR